MKPKTTVFFDNTESGNFRETKEYLFETFADEEGWNSIDDIDDAVVYHEMEELERQEWDDFQADMSYILSTDCYLLTGVCGRWNGPCEGGKFINGIDEFMACLKHLDYIKFYDENGHFYISGYHHDGSDRYELKRLTKKGYALAHNNYFAQDRYLHNTIMNNNFYSALPRIAERLYGG